MPMIWTLLLVPAVLLILPRLLQLGPAPLEPLAALQLASSRATKRKRAALDAATRLLN
jgi:hypothetical protein